MKTGNSFFYQQTTEVTQKLLHSEKRILIKECLFNSYHSKYETKIPLHFLLFKFIIDANAKILTFVSKIPS